MRDLRGLRDLSRCIGPVSKLCLCQELSQAHGKPEAGWGFACKPGMLIHSKSAMGMAIVLKVCFGAPRFAIPKDAICQHIEIKRKPTTWPIGLLAYDAPLGSVVEANELQADFSGS